PEVIPALRVLDFDDISAKIRKNMRYHVACDQARKVQNSNVGQRATGILARFGRAHPIPIRSCHLAELRPSAAAWLLLAPSSVLCQRYTGYATEYRNLKWR